MMKITNFTFIVTDKCNFNCSYCIQKKEDCTIDFDTIDRAVDFFYPFFTVDRSVHIGFYGGEPLLAFEQIKHSVLALDRKNRSIAPGKLFPQFSFSLTTNGSLITDEILTFLEKYRFSVILSFDGLAQNLTRQKGTFHQMIEIMNQIQQFPGIQLEINSVFVPATVELLTESIRRIIKLKGPLVSFDLATNVPWSPKDLLTLKKELKKLSTFLTQYYKETHQIPVTNFQTSPLPASPSSNLKRCGAGTHHMSISPTGHVWGCFMFHDYFKTRTSDPQFKEYSFGLLNDFIENYKSRYPQIVSNYAELRQDFFQVENNFCFLCPEIDNCMICPVNAAYSTDQIGKISCRQCNLNGIVKRAVARFSSICKDTEN